MKIMPDKKRIGTNIVFQGYQFTKKNEKKIIVSSPILSAFIIFIILTFSVNIDFDFVRKAFSQ